MQTGARGPRGGRLWGALLCGALALGVGGQAWGQDAGVGYSVLPTDGRDAAERLIFKAELRYDATSSGLAEAAAPQGEIYNEDQIRTGANYALGDLRLGTRRVLLPTLNTYAIASGGLDIDGQPNITAMDQERARDASEHRYLQQPYGDNALFLHTAYAELEGFTETGALKNLYLRAGRQFHWGVGSVTFDGATFGYGDGALNINARFGQRSGVYNLTQDDLGLVGGVDVSYDFRANLDVPLLLKAEYVFYTRDVNLTERDAQIYNLQSETVTLNLAQLSGYLDITDDVLLSARLKITDTALSRGWLGLRWGISDSALLLVDLHQKIGPDVFYDMTGGQSLRVNNPGTGIERTSSYEVYRLNITDLEPFTEVQARLPWELVDWLTLQPEVGGRFSLGDAQALSPYDASYVNWGLGSYVRAPISDKAGVEFDVRYQGRAYDRSNIQDDGLFTDVSSGPEQMSNEVNVQVAYNRGQRFVSGRMLGNRSLHLGLGGFYKAYVLRSRRLVVGSEPSDNDEAVVGLNAQGRWWATENLNLGLRYEYAKDSNVFYSHLSEFHTVQGSVTAQF